MIELLSRLLGRGSRADAGLQRLAAILSVPAAELAAVPGNPRLCYRQFEIRKRSGRIRQIAAPSGALKLHQRRLLKQYLSQQYVHAAATAFRSGSSIATHARRHLGQQIVLTVDLADFFPATAARRVRRWFREQGWEGAALDVLMRLTVYRGGLPQGAPTSPALSNLVNRSLDEELSELAGQSGGRYSRYCDDLAFSFRTEAEPMTLRPQVEACLARHGYEVQAEKGWRLQAAAEHPEITGLVLAGRRLRLADHILRRIQALRTRWFGLSANDRQRLAGYRGLAKMIKR
ncbi:MAG TPA: reverse transcriptase family protein [Pirellulaceae bacterium]|nr:reverse transcriptase family protein [Pirellulaceae bacterium]